jgi:hypothetical protein
VKRRVPELSEYAGDVPPELRVGKLIEVWAEDGRGHIDAWVRHSRARRSWWNEHKLSDAEYCRLFPGASPWSVEFLIESGRRDEAEQRLTQAGVTLADIPALRTAAQTYAD